MNVVLRTQEDPLLQAPAVRHLVAGLDPAQPVHSLTTMELLAGSMARERFSMAFLTAFAVLAVALAAVGIYGLFAFVVECRRQEIGVRIALGAGRAEVLWMILGQGLRLACVGVVVGVSAAIWLGRLMESLLYETGATDPAVLGTVPAFLTFVSLLASYLPAQRAARVDPMRALRTE